MKKAARHMSFKKVAGWGGIRRDAGRPNQSGEVGHSKRPRVKGSTPLHVTWRLREKSVNLRCEEVAAVFEKSALGAKKFGLRILHFAILANHLHMMVEAADNSDLASGLRSFVIRFVKGVRQILQGRGPLFAGRYHLHVLKTPTEVKRALTYILQNFAKHSKLLWHLDKYSSAPHFGEWRALLGRNVGPLLAEAARVHELPKYLSGPRSWLAREGWRRGRIGGAMLNSKVLALI
jgi:REP element-mobilizing transposase RayT